MLNYFAPSPSVESYLEREGGREEEEETLAARACARSDGDEKEEDLEDDVGVRASALIQIKHCLLCRRSRSRWGRDRARLLDARAVLLYRARKNGLLNVINTTQAGLGRLV